jgi:hypothetical protein
MESCAHLLTWPGRDFDTWLINLTVHRCSILVHLRRFRPVDRQGFVFDRKVRPLVAHYKYDTAEPQDSLCPWKGEYSLSQHYSGAMRDLLISLGILIIQSQGALLYCLPRMDQTASDESPK